jgi:hypothetical protein
LMSRGYVSNASLGEDGFIFFVSQKRCPRERRMSNS